MLKSHLECKSSSLHKILLNKNANTFIILSLICNMIDDKIYNIYTEKNRKLWHLVYWIVSACLMFFIFGNRNYDLQIRLILVSFLIVVSYGISFYVNKYLITKFLFEGKVWLFVYILFAVFIITLWLISFSIILIVTYSAFYLPNQIVPQQDDILILIAGNYLIVVIAVVIHFIKESYKRLIENNNIEKKKQEAELKLKEANLKLLQGQIHPHFLFNMLNNLYGLINEDISGSRDIIIKLSDLLDYMLYECDNEKVLLHKEIFFIENYIKLEKVRHTNNFNIEFDYKLRDKSIKIAPLVLFPFVENAFKHGFGNPRDSFIKINLIQESNRLLFEIENSISEINYDKYLHQEGKGIGLKNIKDRLNLIYNDKYQLNIDDSEHSFKVNLTIELDEK